MKKVYVITEYHKEEKIAVVIRCYTDKKRAYEDFDLLGNRGDFRIGTEDFIDEGVTVTEEMMDSFDETWGKKSVETPVKTEGYLLGKYTKYNGGIDGRTIILCPKCTHEISLYFLIGRKIMSHKCECGVKLEIDLDENRIFVT